MFDNLIHKKQMPLTIGFFINPGVVPAASAGSIAASGKMSPADATTPSACTSAVQSARNSRRTCETSVSCSLGTEVVSQSTAAGAQPAILARSTAASV